MTHDHSTVLRTPNLSLGAAARIFARLPTARCLGAALLISLVCRVRLGLPTWNDGLGIALLVAIQPLVEWLIHVHILHFRPRTVAGVRVDLHAARHHRAHHRDPWDLRYTVMPLPAMAVGAILIAGVVWTLAPSPAEFWTVTATAAGLALTYEWVHYLTHTSYRPRTGHMRHLWKSHRLHHFKNEAYWFGVSRVEADRWLKTSPDPTDVPKSPTARTLGVEHDDGDDRTVDA